MSLRHSRASLLVQKFNSSKQLSFFYRHQVERVRVHCIEINIERHELVVRKARLKGWQRLEVGLARRREGVGATFAVERFVFYERGIIYSGSAAIEEFRQPTCWIGMAGRRK